jgi:hypothetical protein
MIRGRKNRVSGSDCLHDFPLSKDPCVRSHLATAFGPYRNPLLTCCGTLSVSQEHVGIQDSECTYPGGPSHCLAIASLVLC